MLLARRDGPPAAGWRGAAAALGDAIRTLAPLLLFGLRLWASIVLSLYLAFWLQLDTPAWSATTAAFMCQPQLGASLRKGWFRMLGTIAGAVAAVLLTAAVPQDREAFLLLLALWAGLCAVAATLLRNFAAYAAALAAFTASVIAVDQLGPVGGADGTAFTLALTRVVEVGLGIVCAGMVLAATDIGSARRQLGVTLAALAADLARNLVGSLRMPGPPGRDTQPIRRDLLRRVIALDPAIDQAIGESAELRNRPQALQAAIAGGFAVLGGWRAVALRFRIMSPAAALAQASPLFDALAPQLRTAAEAGDPQIWLRDPACLRQGAIDSADALRAIRTDLPSERLLADQAATALTGLADVANALALVADRRVTPPLRPVSWRLEVADWRPPLINGLRTALAVIAMQALWIVTAWPGGAVAMIWATIVSSLFAPRADQAYAGAQGYMVGTLLAVSAAAVIDFALLPGLDGFAAFSLVLAAYFIPAGALLASGWRPPVAIGIAGPMVAFMMPTNTMSFDTLAFYNNAVALLVGNGAALLAFRLVPPVPPAVRTARLLWLTLRDLRRLAMAPRHRRCARWEARMFSRMAALPEEATPLDRARLLVALDLGLGILRLSRELGPEPFPAPLRAALVRIAQGDSQAAIARLEEVDRLLAAPPETAGAIRLRAHLLGIAEALSAHAAYFDDGARR